MGQDITHIARQGQAAVAPRRVPRRALLRALVAALLTALLLTAMQAMATQAAAAEPVQRGPETGLPMPRFVSMKAVEANVRRGPSLSHRIDWVYRRKDLPLEIVAEYGHWRRVRDRDGMGGWVHYSLLSGVRSVLVEAERATLRLTPDPRAREVAHAERGVVARLGECNPGWCRIRAGAHRGWVEKSALWGVAPDEIRD